MPDSASREEASIDLSRLAGLRPVVAIGAMVSIDQPTQMAHRHDAMRFATRHHLTAVPLHDIVALHNAQ
jgi:3,4-dihydroxy-2-butanone 4-phosphate synthase